MLRFIHQHDILGIERTPNKVIHANKTLNIMA